MTSPEAEKPKPKLGNLQVANHWDGNIFAIVGNTLSYLKKADRRDLADEVSKNYTHQGDYYATIGYCMEKLMEAGYTIDEGEDEDTDKEDFQESYDDREQEEETYEEKLE